LSLQVDDDTGALDEDWTMGGVRYTQLHPTALLLHKALTSGGLKDEHVFHQIVKSQLDFMEYYGTEATNRTGHFQWPELVSSFFGSLRAACNSASPYLLLRGRGPAAHVNNRVEWDNFNFPCPGVKSKKILGSCYSPGVGVNPGLLQVVLQMTEHAKAEPLDSSPKMSVWAVGITLDGMAIAPTVVVDEKYRTILGLLPGAPGPRTVQDLLNGGNFDRVDLSKWMATSAGAVVVTTLCRKVSLPVGTSVSAKSGNIGTKCLEEIRTTAKTLGTCASCLGEGSLPVKDGVTTNADFCYIDPCGACETLVTEWLMQLYEEEPDLAYPLPCHPCGQLGHCSALPALRRCGRCVRNDKVCKRLAPLVLMMDCESFQRTAMNMHDESRQNLSCPPSVAQLQCMPDGTHIGKTYKQNVMRHNIVLDGSVASPRLQLLAMFDQPKYCSRLGGLGIERRSLDSMDAQNVSAIPQVAAFAVLVREAEYMTHTPIPEFQRPYPGAMPDDIGPVIHDVAWENIREPFYVLVKAALLMCDGHSPVNVTRLADLHEEVVSLTVRAGVAFLGGRRGVHMLELTPGALHHKHPFYLLAGELDDACVAAGIAEEDGFDRLNSKGKKFALLRAQSGLGGQRTLPMLMKKEAVLREMRRLGVQVPDGKPPQTVLDTMLGAVMNPPVAEGELSEVRAALRKPRHVGGGGLTRLKLSPRVSEMMSTAPARVLEALNPLSMCAISVGRDASQIALVVLDSPSSTSNFQRVVVLFCRMEDTLVVGDLVPVVLPRAGGAVVWTDISAQRNQGDTHSLTMIVCSSTVLQRVSIIAYLQDDGRFLYKPSFTTMALYPLHMPVGARFGGVDVLDDGSIICSMQGPAIGVGHIGACGSFKMLVGLSVRRTGSSNSDGDETTTTFLCPTRVAGRVSDGNVTVMTVDYDRVRLTTRAQALEKYLLCMEEYAAAWGMRRSRKHKLASGTIEEVISVTQSLADFTREVHLAAVAHAGRSESFSTNGPDGCFSSQTRTALQLLADCLRRLSGFVWLEVCEQEFRRIAVKPRSLLTDVNENFHARVRLRIQGGMPTLAQFLRCFFRITEEMLKTTTDIGFQTYFGQSYYQPPESGGLRWSDVRPILEGARIKTAGHGRLSQPDRAIVRQALSGLQRAQQSTPRARTAMFASGTLPVSFYATQRHVQRDILLSRTGTFAASSSAPQSVGGPEIPIGSIIAVDLADLSLPPATMAQLARFGPHGILRVTDSQEQGLEAVLWSAGADDDSRALTPTDMCLSINPVTVKAVLNAAEHEYGFEGVGDACRLRLNESVWEDLLGQEVQPEDPVLDHPDVEMEPEDESVETVISVSQYGRVRRAAWNRHLDG
jgi:hypothetical protein